MSLGNALPNRIDAPPVFLNIVCRDDRDAMFSKVDNPEFEYMLRVIGNLTRTLLEP